MSGMREIICDWPKETCLLNLRKSKLFFNTTRALSMQKNLSMFDHIVLIKIKHWVLSILFYYNRAIIHWKEIRRGWGVSYTLFHVFFFFYCQRNDSLALLYLVCSLLFWFLFREMDDVSKYKMHRNWTQKRRVIINIKLLNFALYLFDWKGKRIFRI